MACFSGILGQKKAKEFSEMITPFGLGTETPKHAMRVRLLEYERMFARGPLDFASYPALAFRLAHCSVDLLMESLAKALAAHPMLAGRLDDCEVAMTNDGVPFTVRVDEGEHAPAEFNEACLRHFADFRCPRRVRRGLEPLLTVKLTRFRDGSGVLAMCRSHGLLDGTSAWVFLGDWAAAARGELLTQSTWSVRGAIEALLPSDEQVEELAVALDHGRVQKTWLGWGMQQAASLLGPVLDGLFLSGVTFPDRTRLFFSDHEVAAIKAAATPTLASGRDGWVSTQEALAAYLLRTVSQVALPQNSKGRALLTLLLDVRKALGLSERTCMGSGISFVGVIVTDILKKDLSQVASEIHEAAKMEATPKKLCQRWTFQAGLNERGMPIEAMKFLMKLRKKSDIVLQLNNQSKRTLPDFGEAAGGPAEAVLTNAGPTLFLPSKGGIDVWLCPSFIGPTGSERAQKAMEALRGQVPKGENAARGENATLLTTRDQLTGLSKVVGKALRKDD